MLFKKNQKPSTGHNFAQFEKFALINGENLTIKGGTGEQSEHGGSVIIISQ
jgi:hypothetical protein